VHIAITTDWLVARGGAERVIHEMQTLWPKAPIFTTIAKRQCIEGYMSNVHTSRLQTLYRMISEHKLLIPFMPRAVESWDLRGFDVIVSSSHAVAKGCIPPSTATHICYCHTPMRYAWEMEEKYLDDFHLFGPLRTLAKHELTKLRAWDIASAKRVDTFIANSNEVAERIRRIYGRESIVLHPPVHDRFLSAPIGAKEPFFLSVGRLVPYKHVNLAIEAAKMMNLPLKIVGDGPDRAKLRHMAGETVEFLGHLADDELAKLYGKARAVIFPVHEDAGIVPLESQACGTPVIALKMGGALDTIIENETGVFFAEQTAASLCEAIHRFDHMTFSPAKIRGHAQKFSSLKFRTSLLSIVEQAVQKQRNPKF